MTPRTLFAVLGLVAFLAIAATSIDRSGAASLFNVVSSPNASPDASRMASPIASPTASGLLATVQAKQSATAAIKTATADVFAAETSTAQAQLDLTATSQAITATAEAQTAIDNAVTNATENAELNSALVVMATDQAMLEETVAAAVIQGTSIVSTSEAAIQAVEATATTQFNAAMATSDAKLSDADSTIEAQKTQFAELELTATANARPTDTPTNTPEPTNTPKPTATATATPSPTPLPQSGDVLYRTGKSGFKRWPLSAEWKYLNGMLVNDGSQESWIHAPFSPGELSNYAVEAEIQIVRNQGAVGLVARANDNGDGYWAGVSTYGGAKIASSLGDFCCGNGLAETDFEPGSDWHTYRLEVEGNTIRFLVDGGLLIETTDNQFLDGGSVGLFSLRQQINVRNFKVIALDNGSGSQDESEYSGDTDPQSGSNGITSIDATAAPTQPAEAAAGSVLPQDFLGTWSGTGVQSDLNLQWDVVLTLNGGATGSVTGTSSYPGLGCEGTLTLVDFDTTYPPYATLAETIVTGQGTCADGMFELSFLEGVPGMSFTWTGSSSGSIGTGTLQQTN